MVDPTSRNLRRVARVLPRAELGGRRRTAAADPAVVASFTAGVLKITYKGQTMAVAYLNSYSPTVGDTVSVLLQDGQVLVLGKPIGTPT